MNYSTMTRITDLLEEFARARCNYKCWPVNEYVDGKVQASGRYEYSCEHCGEKSAWPEQVLHKPECLIHRAHRDVAAALQSDSPPSGTEKQ